MDMTQLEENITDLPEEAIDSSLSESQNMMQLSSDKPKILYVIPFRAKNMYRKKNLKIVLQWIGIAQKYLKENYEITMDIFLIEQDREPYEQIPKENLSHQFIQNPGAFNKGWSFNVAVKQNPSYHYYGFADADIIIPAIDSFCDQLAEHTIIKPKKAFRPFTDRLDTLMADCATSSTFEDFANMIPTIKPKLTKHGGLGFASNMIFMSHDTFDQIGGWDEMFRGWGRYDDFITHKLLFICQCNGVYSPIDAIHLWHPITLDYSLAASQDNIHFYDKYTKYSKNELLKLIDTNRKTNGDPNLYVKNK